MFTFVFHDFVCFIRDEKRRKEEEELERARKEKEKGPATRTAIASFRRAERGLEASSKPALMTNEQNL